ncbi:hypothetical protein LTR62_004991 [Meristemomyces frigidus]|uniref:Uncharacterized protein n=1 Tax=Meristemomyces frigidus TaxID=1508187 RepID=A0AAN7TWB9_9PEZI|nr:hypothetical protein LTR62_004991 [Meristemomyces frigidus]
MDLGNLLEDDGREAAPHQPGSTSQQHIITSSRRLEPTIPHTYSDDSSFTAAGRVVATTAVQPAAQPAAPNVWAGAIARLQTQVSVNTSMLESHRRQVADVEQAVVRLQQEMSQVMHVLQDVRGEVQAITASLSQGGQVASNLQLLATQMSTVDRKAHEVDGAKIQLDLVSNRLRRLEEQGLSSADPSLGASLRESFDPVVAQPQLPPLPPTSLPPMRTVPPSDAPPQHLRGIEVPMTASSSTFSPLMQRQDHPPYASETARHPAAEMPRYRPVEQAAETTMPMIWSHSESAPAGFLPPPPPPTSLAYITGQHRAPAVGGGSQDTGWGTVNPSAKRSFDEPQVPSQVQAGSVQDSPKRPRLAPIISRNYNDSYMQSPVTYQPAASVPVAEMHTGRSRSQSDVSPSLSQILQNPMPVPPGAYRFVPSSTENEGRAIWQPEPDQTYAPHESPWSTPQARGRSSRGRGGKGRSVKSDSAHSFDDRQDFSGASHSRTSWTTGAEEHYPDTTHYTRMLAPLTSTDQTDHPAYPATPVSSTAQDTFPAPTDLLVGSSGKKSRTKPIRNADGVLIRKDGRPDMRSVSSANNLRKVHAKREAGRSEEGAKAPRSARELAPAYSSYAGSSEEAGRGSGSEGSGRSGSPGGVRQQRGEGGAEGGEGEGSRAAARGQNYDPSTTSAATSGTRPALSAAIAPSRETHPPASIQPAQEDILMSNADDHPDSEERRPETRS